MGCDGDVISEIMPEDKTVAGRERLVFVKSILILKFSTMKKQM